MNYEEALVVVYSGGLVSLGEKTLYLSVDFGKGTAGQLFYTTGVLVQEAYEPTAEEEASQDWYVPTEVSDE